MKQRTRTGDEPMVRATPDVLKEIYAHARDTAPAECCGALLGRDGRVVRAVRVANEATRPGSRYRIGPRRVRQLEADADREGLELLGFYHSHPGAAASPSRRDVEAAWPWYVYFIKGADGIRAFRLRPDRSGFRELRVLPTPGQERLAS